MITLAKTAYEVISEILRRGFYEASLESDDSGDLIIMAAYNDASQQLDLMWRWGWINSDTANKLADYFHIDF